MCSSKFRFGWFSLLVLPCSVRLIHEQNEIRSLLISTKKEDEIRSLLISMKSEDEIRRLLISVSQNRNQTKSDSVIFRCCTIWMMSPTVGLPHPHANSPERDGCLCLSHCHDTTTRPRPPNKANNKYYDIGAEICFSVKRGSRKKSTGIDEIDDQSFDTDSSLEF